VTSPNVGVDHSAFGTAQANYAQVIPNIRAIAKNLDDSVQAAESAWKGQAYNAFKTFAGNLDTAIQDLNAQLQATADALYQGNVILGNQDYDSTSSFTSLGNNFDY
jgi:WXG100 family type VII secretion target